MCVCMRRKGEEKEKDTVFRSDFPLPVILLPLSEIRKAKQSKTKQNKTEKIKRVEASEEMDKM